MVFILKVNSPPFLNKFGINFQVEIKTFRLLLLDVDKFKGTVRIFIALQVSAKKKYTKIRRIYKKLSKSINTPILLLYPILS